MKYKSLEHRYSDSIRKIISGDELTPKDKCNETIKKFKNSNVYKFFEELKEYDNQPVYFTTTLSDLGYFDEDGFHFKEVNIDD